MEEFVYDESYSFPNYAVINLTNQCNYRCPYCFMEFNKRTMSLETAQQSCEFVLKNHEIYPKGTPGITFFGGEPLLHKSIIYQIVQEYADRIEFCITTNGSLLDEDFILFCHDYNVSIMISMDGARKTQERQRPCADLAKSSFDLTMKNIHYYIAMNPQAMMRATLTKESIPEIYENYLFAKQQGFKVCTFVLDDLNGTYDEEDVRIYEEQMNKIAVNYLEDLVNDRPTIKVTCLNDWYERMTNIQTKGPYPFSMMRCGYGTTSCGVTPEGNIIPCQEKSSLTEPLIIGNIFDGINQEKHKEILENYYKQMTSIKCPNNCCKFVKGFCHSSLCSSRLENRDFEIPIDVCHFNLVNARIALRLYHFLYNSRFNRRELNDLVTKNPDDIIHE